MATQELNRHVEIGDNGHTVAAAEVTSEGPGGTAWASLRAESGHITPGRRASLVDAVLDLPEVRESAHLNVVFPLGDAETLQRLQERCRDVRTHSAGDSAIMEAKLPSGGPGGRPADFSGPVPAPSEPLANSTLPSPVPRSPDAEHPGGPRDNNAHV